MLSSDGKYINQVDSRILRCRKSYFSFNNVDLKLHFWHTICRPIFGLETVYLNRAMYIKLKSLQGTIVKAFLGLSRYSHHSKLALGILPIKESIKSMQYSKNTLFGRLLDMGLSPILSALSTFKYTQKYSAGDGVVTHCKACCIQLIF